jgi:hypothetical protein
LRHYAVTIITSRCPDYQPGKSRETAKIRRPIDRFGRTSSRPPARVHAQAVAAGMSLAGRLNLYAPEDIDVGGLGLFALFRSRTAGDGRRQSRQAP